MLSVQTDVDKIVINYDVKVHQIPRSSIIDIQGLVTCNRLQIL